MPTLEVNVGGQKHEVEVSEGATQDDINEILTHLTGEGMADAPESEGSGWSPTIKRVGGAALGTIGGGVAGLIAGGPVGAAAGAYWGGGVGSAAGDYLAQQDEIAAGEREGYNPLRGAAEFGLGLLPGGSFSAPLKDAAVRGALYGSLSTTVTSLAEGNGLPSVGEFAIGTLSGGAFGAMVHGAGKTLIGIGHMVQNLEGGDKIAEQLGNDALDELAGNPIAAAEGKEVFTGGAKVTDSPSTAEGIMELGRINEQLPLFQQGELPLWMKTEPDWGQPKSRNSMKLDISGVEADVDLTARMEKMEKRSILTGRMTKWPKEQMSLDMNVRSNPRDIVDGTARQGELFGDQPISYRKRAMQMDKESAFINSVVDDETAPSNLIHEDMVSKDTAITPDGVAEMSGVPPQNATPPKMRDANPFMQNLFQHILPRKSMMLALQKATGYDTFGDFYQTIGSYRKMQAKMSEYGQQVKDIFGRTPTAKRVAYSEWMWDPENRDRTALARGFTKDDHARVAKLERFYNKMLAPFDLDVETFAKEVIPAYKNGEYARYNPETGEGGYTGEAPLLTNRMKNIADYITNGEIGVGEPDSLLSATRILRASAFKQHMEEGWGQMYAKYTDEGIPDEVKQHMVAFLNVVRGQPDKWNARLTNMLNTVLSASDPLMDKMGRRHVRTTANAFVSDVMAAAYAGTMGWRIGPVIRNAFQPIQTAAALMGTKWLRRGMMAGMTDAGKNLAKEMGITTGGALQLSEIEEAARSGVGRVMQGAARSGLSMFGKVEDGGRRAIYLGTRAKFMNAAEEAAKLSDPIERLQRFVDLSDLDRYEPGERQMVGNLYAQGKVEEAAHHAANMMVDNTAFMYTMPERTPLLSTTAGRMVGGFGNWPSNYAAYLSRVTPGLGEGPTRKVWRDFGRFFAMNSMLVAGFSGIGYALGDEDSIKDNLGWTFLSPTFYSGGPIFESAIAGAKGMASLTQGDFGSQNFRAGAEAGLKFLPGYGLFEDLDKAAREKTPEGAIGRITGFKRGRK